jgi:antitoxin HicB
MHQFNRLLGPSVDEYLCMFPDDAEAQEIRHDNIIRKRTVDDYIELPYHIEAVRDYAKDGATWFARVVELPGCMTQADTWEELGTMVEDAMRGWIEGCIEVGMAVPEPEEQE